MSTPKKLREMLAEREEEPRLRMGNEFGKDAYDYARQLARLVVALEAKVKEWHRKSGDKDGGTDHAECADEIERDILGPLRGTGG